MANAVAGANGKYTLNVNALTFPILLQATDPASATRVLYAWAHAGGTSNIAALTTLALMTSNSSRTVLPST